MSEVRLASGRKINWNRPPKSNQICSLVIGGKKYKGSFRTLCHLNRTNNLAKKKFGTGLTVLQGPYNKSVAASAGTHDFDAVWDVWINGVPAYTQQRFFRSLGWMDWYRKPPTFANHHHMGTLPPHRGGNVSDDFKQAGMKVGKYVDGGISTVGRLITSSQIADYYNHAFGLSGQHKPGSDKSWFPRRIPDTVFNLRAYVDKRAR